MTDDGRIHSIHAVGVFFRDDADADVVDDERARGMLAALCDAHAALTIDVSRTLAMNGGAGGRYYREEVVERARTCARATTALVRACCARDGDGRAKHVRAGGGECGGVEIVRGRAERCGSGDIASIDAKREICRVRND